MKARLVEILSREDARREMQRLGVDPGGFAYMLPKQQHYNLKLEALPPPAANIIKQEMLSIGAEAAVSKGTVSCAIKETGCLLSGTVGQLQRLAKKLERQPYGLDEVACAIEEALKNISVAESGGFVFSTPVRRFDMKRRALVMGILNVTPDSFSDGGEFNEPMRAVERALEMVEEGADIIDVGGESTRPGAAVVGEAEERSRTLPVVEALVKAGLCVSIDTTKSNVAKAALDAGAEMVNDVSALSDKDMAGVIAGFKAAVILMHRRGSPADMQSDTGYDDIMADIYNFLARRIELAESAGIERERIAIDPGIGFGKSIGGNLEILRRLGEFATIGRPLLVGVSRKSFIGSVVGGGQGVVGNRLNGTFASQSIALIKGAAMLRVHDVRAARELCEMAAAIRQGEAYGVEPEGSFM